MSKPTLTYFGGRGRAEVARLIFAESGTEYTDNRVTNLTELRAAGKLAFNQVPLLEANGISLVQSGAIDRYLAKKHGLYGSTEEEGAKVDEVYQGVTDWAIGFWTSPTDEAKATYLKEKALVFAGYFQSILEKAGGEFFIGKFSLADIAVQNTTFFFLQKNPDLLKDFPLLKKNYEATSARPKIAEWIKNRPQSSF